MTDIRPGTAEQYGILIPYTQGTHDALVAAQAVSRPSSLQAPRPSERHAAVDAAHLMLGILAQTTATGTRALTDQGIALGRARMRVAALTLPPPPGLTGRSRRLPAVDAVLAVARAAATRHGDAAVGTGHLLIALEDALAPELTALGLDLAAAERFVLAAYADSPPRPRDTGREFT